MPINWQDKNVADRILAAIIASHKNQVNHHPLFPDRSYTILPDHISNHISFTYHPPHPNQTNTPLIPTSNPQINCAEVARLFGQEASYDAIEGFLRKPKKVAAQLIEEAEGKPCPMKSPRKAKRSAATPSPRKQRGLSSAEKGAAGFSAGMFVPFLLFAFPFFFPLYFVITVLVIRLPKPNIKRKYTS